jgi:hypothetical protein
MSAYAQVNEIVTALGDNDLVQRVPVDEWPRARTAVAIRLDDAPARIATWWVDQGQFSPRPR